MTESLEPIERTPTAKTSDRVNPADRSNPEKKDNGFSNALKEKMKEKLKKKAQQNDEVILKHETDENEKPESQQADPADEINEEPDAEEETGGDLSEHVDLKA